MSFAVDTLVPIKALSYWRYTRLKKCKLSGAYPNSVIPKAALPNPQTRAQVIGNIFHAQMEAITALIADGNVDGSKFRDSFNLVLNQVSAKLATDSSSNYLGEIASWPEIAEVYSSLSRLVQEKRTAFRTAAVQVFTEKTLHSRDQTLFGQPDAFFVHDDGIDLVDYKSGSLQDDELLKQDYVDQLYFYAFLISENFDRYPRSLRLTAKNLYSVDIPPDQARSLFIATEMRRTLDEYNNSLRLESSPMQFANPATANCVFCDAKPVCTPFWKSATELSLPVWSHAVIGFQSKPMSRTKAGVGILEMLVEMGSITSRALTVTRIFEGRHPQFQDTPGQHLMLLNLRLVSQSDPPIAEMTDRSIIIPLDTAE